MEEKEKLNELSELYGKSLKDIREGSIIKGKIVGITNKEVVAKIQNDFGLNVTYWFVVNFYRNHFYAGVGVFQWQLNREEKVLNSLNYFNRLMAGFNRAEERDHMDFKMEAIVGKSFSESYRHAVAMTTYASTIADLGARVGYFPTEMALRPVAINIQQNNLNVENEYPPYLNPKIMQVLKATLNDEDDKPPASPYNNPVVAEIVDALFNKPKNPTQENNSLKDDKQAEQSQQNL